MLLKRFMLNVSPHWGDNNFESDSTQSELLKAFAAARGEFKMALMSQEAKVLRDLCQDEVSGRDYFIEVWGGDFRGLRTFVARLSMPAEVWVKSGMSLFQASSTIGTVRTRRFSISRPRLLTCLFCGENCAQRRLWS
jgi:hypothetical protein